MTSTHHVLQSWTNFLIDFSSFAFPFLTCPSPSWRFYGSKINYWNVRLEQQFGICVFPIFVLINMKTYDTTIVYSKSSRKSFYQQFDFPITHLTSPPLNIMLPTCLAFGFSKFCIGAGHVQVEKINEVQWSENSPLLLSMRDGQGL